MPRPPRSRRVDGFGAGVPPHPPRCRRPAAGSAAPGPRGAPSPARGRGRLTPRDSRRAAGRPAGGTRRAVARRRLTRAATRRHVRVHPLLTPPRLTARDHGRTVGRDAVRVDVGGVPLVRRLAPGSGRDLDRVVVDRVGHPSLRIRRTSASPRRNRSPASASTPGAASTSVPMTVANSTPFVESRSVIHQVSSRSSRRAWVLETVPSWIAMSWASG